MELPENDMMIGKSNVGAGWQALLQATVDKLNELDCTWRPFQVKEKFGELRFYIEATGEQANDAQELVNEAERESSTICEECGEDGETASVVGWYRTLCPDDLAKAIKERKEQWAEIQSEEERYEEASGE